METSGAPSVEVIAVSAEKVPEFWPLAHEYIWPAFERFPGEATYEDITKRLLEGNMVLWIAWNGEEILGGAITALENYPSGMRAVRGIALGGKQFESWQQPLDDILEQFGKSWGAQRIEFYGRKGWEKRLPNYKVNRIMVTRDI